MRRFYKFLMLLVALFAMMPAMAQNSCQIKIVGEDGYGDGWNGGSLAVMQGSTTVATFNGANFPEYEDGPELDSLLVTVSSGTAVTFVWTSGSYDDEVTIWIYDGGNALVYSVNEPSSGTIYTLAEPCPACFPPANLAATVSGSDATVTWAAGTATSWEIAWGVGAFNPDTAVTNFDYASTNSYTFYGLANGIYKVYVRADCGTDGYSAWTPLTVYVGTMVMNMAVTGTQTISTCSAVIYDNGGPSAAYSSNCNSTLVITPDDATHWVSVSGSSYTESTFDYLQIYEGVGTSGDLLWSDY